MFNIPELEYLPLSRPASAHMPKPDWEAKAPLAEEACGYWVYCDNCGTRLQNFRCRLICPQCGFFHSCSEP
ncbi:MAG: hypothetical protein ONB48_05545 [candidate division KSB1 bacterium]|nr:hypothetical protein [candidate division KSB1 bacterium]MDZ7273011.1 hypothetical protein [candidate division KSB1 bacterium]MDZ7285114.1 hypothetical protein [candidate division KSB1 bacterium]MDZ7298146.1 hypothetical protein [candidate division KSB1 bacterium]MDZ7306900.1 hypothetical protein [candidate division KSB1 bacterium]